MPGSWSGYIALAGRRDGALSWNATGWAPVECNKGWGKWFTGFSLRPSGRKVALHRDRLAPYMGRTSLRPNSEPPSPVPPQPPATTPEWNPAFQDSWAALQLGQRPPSHSQFQDFVCPLKEGLSWGGCCVCVVFNVIVVIGCSEGGGGP